jgi:hypothetical protein
MGHKRFLYRHHASVRLFKFSDLRGHRLCGDLVLFVYASL